MRTVGFFLLLVAAPVMALDGDALVKMQRQLNDLGYSIADQEGNVGPDTKQAVALFREDYDLPERQRLGNDLASLVNERYVSMYQRRGESVPAPKRIPSGKLGKYCVVTSGTLALATNDRKLQLQLGELGYRPGNIHGRMSAETRAAISSFQLDYDLPVTGNADTTTLQSLLNAVKTLRRNHQKAEQVRAAGA